MVKKKTYVLDTSVLIDNPGIISDLAKENKVVIPLTVIRQLDGLKNSENEEKAEKARKASRVILKAQEENKVEVLNNFKKIDALSNEADNKIIGTCLMLKEKEKESKEKENNVNLLTTDVNMKIAAQSMGIGTEEPKTTDWIGNIVSALLIDLIMSGIFWMVMANDHQLSKGIFRSHPVIMMIIISFVFGFIVFLSLITNKNKTKVSKTKNNDLDTSSYEFRNSYNDDDGWDTCNYCTTPSNSFMARFWEHDSSD